MTEKWNDTTLEAYCFNISCAENLPAGQLPLLIKEEYSGGTNDQVYKCLTCKNRWHLPEKRILYRTKKQVDFLALLREFSCK